MSLDERAILNEWIVRYQRENESLLDFIPRITRQFVRPSHLGRVAELFHRARRGERVRALVSAPPRHAKTELLLHAIPWYLLQRPRATVAYISYGAQFAEGKSRSAREYASEAGFVTRSDFDTVAEWRNPQFGGCVATGIGGPLTGKGFDLCLLDDPHKDRIEAESPLLRDRVHEWFSGTALTRVEPGGSVIVFQQRWHDDDLIGRLSRDTAAGWELVNLPALSDGQPLWPERWPVEELERKRLEVGEYNWHSQYLGVPIPRGGKVFETDFARFIQPDLHGARIVLSVDAAGTESTLSDYTAAVAIAVRGTGAEQRADILEVWRDQLTPEHAAPHLKDFQARNGGGAMLIENTRDGKSLARALHSIDPSLRLQLITPLGEKFVRMQPVAAAANQGRVRIPMHAPWVPEFLNEAGKFTGIGDRHDDMLDALSQAWNAATQSPGVPVQPPVIPPVGRFTGYGGRGFGG